VTDIMKLEQWDVFVRINYRHDKLPMLISNAAEKLIKR